ncbi:MAG TPA: proline dehydrogenase family protein, partial [Thermoleophilia bacterium]|nr:proline dehydrogenase family protein [Thermoleophilia bacterium]
MGLLTLMARRFVAGKTADSAMAAVRKLNARKICTTLDILGEDVTERAEATRAADDYIALLDRIAQEGVEANVSLKLTMMGLEIDKPFCLDNVHRVVATAAKHGNFVRVDMEGSPVTQATLDTVRELFKANRNVGAVIQSYLYRSADDVKVLNAAGIKVRLCKGAYREPREVAFQDKRDVNTNYSKLMQLLLKDGTDPAIATHDTKLINECKQLVARNGMRKDQFEFQMLYGIRSALQRTLAGDGYRVRCYVPFG